MTNHFALGMTKATELTKAGKLAEATALIQSLLNDAPPTAPVATDHSVIEATFTRLNNAHAANAEKPQPAPPQTKPQRQRISLRNIASGGRPDHAGVAKGGNQAAAGCCIHHADPLQRA
jgi:hypothetical protein